MTRKQVAARLGKSVATVRRIEGILLHPNQDANGVHRFDRGEVETLARDLEQGRLVLAHELRRTGYETPGADSRQPCANCATLHEEVETLRIEGATERARHQRELAALRTEHNNEAREFLSQVHELIAAM